MGDADAGQAAARALDPGDVPRTGALDAVPGLARSRDKGARIEWALVAAPRFGGEVSVPLLGFDRRLEVKGHANGLARAIIPNLTMLHRIV